jgi:hypothetical protein
MKSTKLFSYFKPGVTNVIPLLEVELPAVYALIKSSRLKEITEKIREGRADKSRDLPSACFSGTFKSRGITGLLQYSGLICLDVDKLDDAPSLKEKLSKDAFLNPMLLFISPRGHGLKIIVRVKYAEADKHEVYFEALTRYLKGAYGIEIDASGKDVSRLCFLCWDPEPFYFEDGFVTAEALLRLIPTPSETKTPHSISADYVETLKERRCRDARSRVSAWNGDARNGDARSRVSTTTDQLNHLPAVHNLAMDALRRHGWKQKSHDSKLWVRAGKDIRKGHSAAFDLYPAEGIHILYNFSSNAQPFAKDKGYSDCQVICELDYGGDFARCISDLSKQFFSVTPGFSRGDNFNK